jgi:signal transduction histidine kinase/uncharacterized protein HemY
MKIHKLFWMILSLSLWGSWLYPAVNQAEKALADSIQSVSDAKIFPLVERFHRLYVASNPKAALRQNQRALQIAKATKDELQTAIILHRIAICQNYLKNSKSALDYDQQSLQLCRKLNYPLGMAKALTSIGRHYFQAENLPTASRYLTEAYTAARISKDQIAIINVLDLLAIIAREKGDRANDIHYNLEAYQLSIQQNESSDVAYFGINLGLAYHNNSQYDKALEYFEASRKVLEKKHDQTSLSKVYNNMGNSFVKLGDYKQGLQCYLKSLELKENNSSPQEISIALVNLGSIYLKLEQYPKALEHYIAALKIKQETKDKKGMASIYSSMGVVYRKLGQDTAALNSYQLALKLYRQDEDNIRLAQTLNNIGVLYSEQGNPAKALSLYAQSLQLKGIKSDDSARISSYLNIADIYLTKQPDLAKAKVALDMVKDLPSFHQLPDLRVKLYSLLSTWHEQKGDYPASLHYYKEFKALQDSIYTNLNSRSLAELDVKYELSSKEKQIGMLRKNAELNQQILSKSRLLRNYLVIIILLVVILAVFIFSRYRSLQRYNRLIMENDAELQKLNQSLEQRVESEVAIRRQQEQQAFHQARLAALGELAAGIAHELNQPLHSLAFTLDNILLYLKEEQADPEYLNQKLDYLFDDISRMRNAIDHIRHFARQKTDLPDALFSVNESIRQTISLVQKQFEKQGISIETALQEDLPGIVGNPFKLEQVMLNLLSNSRDALLENMKTEAAASPRICVNSHLQDGLLIISCLDNGCGMSESVQEHAFQSFYTTKDKNQGTGLGLTISKGIIQDLGGDIRLESTVHKGSKVTISLPVALDEAHCE